MNNIVYGICIMAVVAFVTVFTRVLPFALFGGKKGMPKMIGYLGRVLPAAIIAALVVYCFKGWSSRRLQTDCAVWRREPQWFFCIFGREIPC